MTIYFEGPTRNSRLRPEPEPPAEPAFFRGLAFGMIGALVTWALIAFAWWLA